MKILITGNLGYIGPSFVKEIRSSYPMAEIVGIDLGLFSHCITDANIIPEVNLDKQIYKDVRFITIDDLNEFDSVIHLAAISNDPMGQNFAKITDEINFQSSIKIARLSKKAGVKNYVFASSCSVYGEASEHAKVEEDNLNPLTAYAKSKIDTEIGLRGLESEDFVITCLRFATACGFTERTRLDLVLNDFVADAVLNGEINILSDGSPWRPLINTKDMARAANWALDRDFKNGGAYCVANIGSNDWNYQVKDLAYAVADIIGGINVSINKNAQPDKRSYKVDFSKFHELAPDYQPKENLESTIKELKEGILNIGLIDKNFRDSSYIRLNVLKSHINSKRLDNSLSI